MATRFYEFGGLSSVNGVFTVDGVSHTYSFSGTYGGNDASYAVDIDYGSQWTGNYYYAECAWQINFSSSFYNSFKLLNLSMYLWLENPCALFAYDDSSWTMIAYLPRGWTNGVVVQYEQHQGKKYSAFKLYKYNSSSYRMRLYDIRFTFEANDYEVIKRKGFELESLESGRRTEWFDNGFALDDIEIASISNLKETGLYIEGPRIGVFGNTNNKGLEIENVEIGNIYNKIVTGLDIGEFDNATFTHFNGIANSSGEIEISTIKHFQGNGNDTGVDDASDISRNVTAIDVYVEPGGDVLRIRAGNDVGLDTAGNRYSNVRGIEVDNIEASSTAIYRYALTVTPTHQYKNMPVKVSLVSRSTVGIYGRYSVILNDSVIIQPAAINAAMNNIDFVITPSQLTIGINKVRIKLLYSDGVQEYLDFEVLKEESKRTVVERLFRDYDGGFTGNGYAPPQILIPNIYPSWFATINSPTSLMKTTDYTRISLAHYTAMQGVSIVGSGLSILVSFDKGATWESFINNVWTPVDVSNIAIYGMTVEAINGITIAQWTDIFTPTSIDFAVYFNDNSLNNFYALETSPSIVLYGATNLTLTNNLTTTIQIPDGYMATKITSADKGGSINPSYPVIRTIYSNIHPTGYAYEMPGSCVYSAQTGERVSKVTFYRYNGTAWIMVTVKGQPVKAYLKSITVNMIPSPFTGYAFII